MAKTDLSTGLNRQEGRQNLREQRTREGEASLALLTDARYAEVQRLHEEALADLRYAVAHPKIQEASKATLAKLLAWMETHPRSLLPPAREDTVRRVVFALQMEDRGRPPPPPKVGPRKRPPGYKPRRFTRPEIAPFLNDPSLLPKKPPTRTP